MIVLTTCTLMTCIILSSQLNRIVQWISISVEHSIKSLETTLNLKFELHLNY